MAEARRAAPDRTARRLFGKAEVHYDVGEFQEALRLYKEAYKAQPIPALLFNMGQCHRYLGDHKKSLFYYQLYLARDPGASNRAEVRQLADRVRQSLADEQHGASAAAPPSHAEPASSGMSRPTGGALQPGQASTPLEARDGAPPNSSSSESSDGSSSKQGQADHPASRHLAAGCRSGDEPSLSDGWHRKLWLWSGVGVSLGLLTAGTVTGVLAAQRSDEYTDPQTPIEQRPGLKDSGDALATASIVTLVLGAAAATATVLYYFLSYRKFVAQQDIALVPGPGGLAAVGSVRF